MELEERYNFAKLFSGPLANEESCKNWIRDMELIPSTIKCRECNKFLQRQGNLQWGSFICNKRWDHESGTPFQIGAAQGTFFDNTSLNPIKIITLLYCFAHGYSIRMACDESSIDNETTTSTTAIEWYRISRDILINYMDELYQAPKTIGGEDKIVEVEDFPVHHRKFNKGRFIQGDYVVAICEQGEMGAFKLEHSPCQVIETRDGNDLTEEAATRIVRLLNRHLTKDTEIYIQKTNSFYIIEHNNLRKIKKFTYQHSKVSLPHFKAWLSNCGQLKNAHQDPHLAQRLCEYFWRRHVSLNKLDEFNEIIRAVRVINTNRVQVAEIEFISADVMEEPEHILIKVEPEDTVIIEECVAFQ